MWRRWIWILPPAVSLVLYGGALHLGFVFDDLTVVETQLPRFTGFLDPLLHYQQLIHKVSRYRPLAWWSWMVSARLGGGTPFAFHLVPWLLHAGSTSLVYILARSFLSAHSRATGAALAVALLFAVHPVHVEAVAWSSSISDGWLTLCSLGSLLAYHRFRHGGERIRWLVVSAVLFFLALLAKETALAMLCLYPLYDLLLARDLPQCPVSQRCCRYLPVALACAVYLALRYYNLGEIAFGRAAAPSLVNAGGKILSAYGYYLRKCFVPGAMETYLPQVSIAPGAVFGGLLLLMGGCGVIVRTWRSHPLICFHLLFLLLGLAPAAAAAVVTVSLTPLAERYLYLPSYGPVFLVGWGVASLFPATWQQRPWRLVVAACCGVAVGCCAVVAIRQRVRVWDDNRSFWGYAMQQHPHEALPYIELVKVAAMNNDCVQAGAYFEQGHRRKMASAYFASLLYLNYGLCLHRTGRLVEAEPLYLQALMMAKSPEGYSQLGHLYLAQVAQSPTPPTDLLMKAHAACTETHRRDPANYHATYCLGASLEGEPLRKAEAAAYYRQTVQLAPAGHEVAQQARAALTRMGEAP